jgi:O-antigen/teichoic acid export membrane protein
MLHAQTAGVVMVGRQYLVIVPIYALMGLPRHPLQGRGDFVPWNIMRVTPNVLWIAVLFFAWVIARPTPSFLAITNLIAMASLVFPFALIASRRIAGPFYPDRGKLLPMLRYGFPCMVTLMPQILNLRLDQMVMAAVLPARELGLYVVAVAWSNAVMPLLGAIGAVTCPAVASAPDPEEAARRFAAGSRVTAMLAVVLCTISLAVTPKMVVLLFGPEFHGAVATALVLVPAGAILGFNVVLQEGLRGIGKPYEVLRAELAGVGVTAVALAAMLHRMGTMGAALASVFGYLTIAIVLLFSARRYTEISFQRLLIPSAVEVRSLLNRFKAAIGYSAVAAQ